VKNCQEDGDWGLRLRNDLYCVEWGVKLYSLMGIGAGVVISHFFYFWF